MLSKWIVPWLNNKQHPSNFYFHKSWLYFWFLQIWTFYRNVYAYFRSIEAKACSWTIIFMKYILKSLTPFFSTHCAESQKHPGWRRIQHFAKLFIHWKQENVKMWKCENVCIILQSLFTETCLYEFFSRHFTIRIPGSAKIHPWEDCGSLTCPFFWIFPWLFFLLIQTEVPSCSR